MSSRAAPGYRTISKNRYLQIHPQKPVDGKTLGVKITFYIKPRARPDALIIHNHASVFSIVLHFNHQHRQEVDLSIRVHPIFVSGEDLHVVLEPFDFDEGFVGFTLKGHHGVLLIGTGVLKVLDKVNCCFGCNEKIQSETWK